MKSGAFLHLIILNQRTTQAFNGQNYFKKLNACEAKPHQKTEFEKASIKRTLLYFFDVLFNSVSESGNSRSSG